MQQRDLATGRGKFTAHATGARIACSNTPHRARLWSQPHQTRCLSHW